MNKHLSLLTVFFLLFPSLFAFQTDSLNLSWNYKLDSLLRVASSATQDTCLVQLYIDIGQMYADNDFNKAKEYYTKAGVLSEKTNWNKGRYMYAIGFSNMLYREGLIDSGLVVIRGVYDLAKRENNRHWIAKAAMNIGSGFFYKTWLETTLTYYQEALHILEETGDDNETLLKLYDNSGVVYRVLGLPDKAIEYHQKALDSFGNEEPLLKGNVLYNLATAYQMNKGAETEYYFKEALRVCEMYNNKLVMAAIYLGLSNLYLHENLNEAEKYCRKALVITTQINNPNLGGLANGTLGIINIFKINLREAEQYFLTSIEMAEQIGYSEYQVTAYRQLSILYGMKHDFERCRISFIKADSIERAMARVETLRSAEEMAAKYETEKKELEIERQQQVIGRQNLQRIMLIGGIIVCFVFLALLWYMLLLRNRRNHALSERNDALSEMNATKDKFFSIISHDLKNPAIAMRDAIQLLVKNDRVWDAGVLSEYYSDLLKSADGQVELLYNLLNWAKIQTGRMIYSPTTFRLVSHLRHDLSLIHGMAEKKGISFSVKIADNTLVTGDSNMLVTVLRNLLTNAIKFTLSGGMVTLEITPNKTSSVLSHTFSVTDTGIGMTAKQIQNLFILDNTCSYCGTAGEQGSGLGLIVCKELLEKHGSNLHVESKKDKGSRFWFTL